MHAGWAAQSGLRAAQLARAGFTGPRTVFDGPHNVFRAFSPSVDPDRDALIGGLGETWVAEQIAFKPYACGTMIHPYIDCMLRLAEHCADAGEIADIECKTSELIVHRLWEPLGDKQRAGERLRREVQCALLSRGGVPRPRGRDRAVHRRASG